jgi:uncharacterized protein (TIGR03437 family)
MIVAQFLSLQGRASARRTACRLPQAWEDHGVLLQRIACKNSLKIIFAVTCALWTATAQAQDLNVVNGASFEAARPVASGGVSTVFGNFEGVTPASAQGTALPDRLSDISVLLDGRAAGLYSVSPAQINFQVPLDFASGIDAEEVKVEVRRGDTVIATAGMLVRDVSPAIFVSDANHEMRPAIALNADGTLNSQQNPSRPGDTLRIFLSGQGKDLISAPTELGPIVTAGTPLIHFRTWKGETIQSSLPPGGVPGLWLVDVRVPQAQDVPDGATPVTVTLDGRTSNTAAVWIDW